MTVSEHFKNNTAWSPNGVDISSLVETMCSSGAAPIHRSREPDDGTSELDPAAIGLSPRPRQLGDSRNFADEVLAIPFGPFSNFVDGHSQIMYDYLLDNI